MTTIFGYHILACPYCKQIHQKIVYGSTNSIMSHTLSSTARICTRCKKPLNIDEMTPLGFETILKESSFPFDIYNRPKNKLAFIWYKFYDLFPKISLKIKLLIKRRKYSKQAWYTYPEID